jgi:hypothetical protein
MSAAGAAGSVALALGAGVAPAAGAPAAHRAAYGNIYTTSQAGYRTGFGTGWRFRWVITRVKVFGCGDGAAMHGWQANRVMLGANSRALQAGVSVGCATMGAGAPVTYSLTRRGETAKAGLLPVHPRAGQWVSLSVYYDQQAGEARFGASLRRGSVTRSVRIGKQASFLGAQAGSVFGRTGLHRVGPLVTGQFTDSHVTSYNVTRGTLMGPWPTNPVLATERAEPAGLLIARPSPLRADGAVFAVRQARGD